jgi:hypothetical protein
VNEIIALLVLTAVGVPILLLSMFIASFVFDGIDFGPIGVAAGKAAGLIFVTSCFGVFLGIGGAIIGLFIWIAGLIVVFKLHTVEAIVLAIINAVLSRVLAGALLAALT